MKIVPVSLVLAAGMAMSPAAFTQIPVTVTSQAMDSPMTLAEFAANTARWAQQVEQMKSQIDQMRQQYSSITGSRGLGTIMNNPALRDYLPKDWQGVYDAVKNGGYDGLSGRGAQIYADNKMFDSCAFIKADDAKKACEARAVKPSQDKAAALDAYDAAKGRLAQIDQLMGKINDTQDPKAIAELQARIGAEQAMIQAEQTKLHLYQMVAQAEEKVQAQRQRELNAKAGARRGWIQPQVTN
ncbi:P-type DNA transfer protein VirB5 [Burkholderia multivorans]|uniref:P-type DNA transfer protein VirB5 n=1 Tax=Burkholderia multivorans TaxID=87883 RepID=UPI000CFEAA64|nr:P-type DNA transfer protein VirB5 [Burkholderia multivorans]MBY4796673.1 P-type DNA transfer protein VirB5 [Burkholderia multivorans]MCA7959294.1 P-type DNA transfer protein VirB5 [Burkholderia multivorans]MDN7596035.1 P-type DNA transfer protein VirB5 [Burkholderia multivorans]PRE73176.1 P-type DNA transfer protein VirB5 [Burkholderia multivorans]PRE85093.1 P-type DNA transfer protein VirB5 [Burkholderia multivorans]